MFYMFTSLLFTYSNPILPYILDQTGILTMFVVDFGKWAESTGHIINSTWPFSYSFFSISPESTVKSSIIRLWVIIDRSGELYTSSKLKAAVESFQTILILKKFVFNFLAALHFSRFSSLGPIISFGKLSTFWKMMLGLEREWLETALLLVLESELMDIRCIFTKFFLRFWYSKLRLAVI